MFVLAVVLLGVWEPPTGLVQTPLWPNPPVSTEIADDGGVRDVNVPTLTVFPAKGARAAVIVFPGGGFKGIAIGIEGTEVCDWLVGRGITCVLAKYRVPKTNHYWDDACKCHITPKERLALHDAQRAVRVVRHRAQELGIDKVGVMGFSAGGYLVAQVSNIFEPAYKRVDEVDAVSSRPDFAIAFFPGHLCREGTTLDPGIHVTKRTPPTFLLQAWDDPVDPICNSTLYARALDDAGVPTEVHLFAKGGHAFALRPKKRVVDTWPALLTGWLTEVGVLQ